ncbi:hypothetical protein OO007_08735 [Cocleimonas sp. KMM 6892]|uniref:hypothetical protein n=1 Tax=unclassified Cocleimonas TaxID=2639732 RepID=UPI002DB883A7|nr:MULTISPECIES: hypothetical protein [unclassified Cocleimonas]MEB8432313.1 hypothetical protein [Cocleimonas sp. KMM 6892]MEC4714601.1 hypothetical protein [Cocleimonas sp. KMM 6895]MEC4744585.1 hypothetical protein [Cocleimonas sp. KMM 6896]
MDEIEFRNTYNKLNPNRCVFEKAITNRRCDCELKRKFVLATREGVACQSKQALEQCTQILNAIRDNARFSLKIVTIDGPMPHNKELQVQAGGMLALQFIFEDDSNTKIETNHDEETNSVKQQTVINIHQTMQAAIKRYQTIDQLPYGEIVKDIVKYQSRPKRHKKK